MKDLLTEFHRNKILMTTISGWLIAQTIKVVLGVFRQKKFDNPDRLVPLYLYPDDCQVSKKS